FAMALLLNPNIIGAVKKVMPARRAAAASPLIVIAIMPFIARFGADIGPGIELVIRSGPALLLQEIGNLGTSVLAFPVAVGILALGREPRCAVPSIARAPTIALAASRHGPGGPAATGVLGVYVMGAAFGPFPFAFSASGLSPANGLSSQALPMPCRARSGSM